MVDLLSRFHYRDQEWADIDADELFDTIASSWYATLVEALQG